MKKNTRLLLENLENRILWNAVPDAAIETPENVKLNEKVEFTVNFDNKSSEDTGFRPFVNLTIPEGMDFEQATFLGSAVKSTTFTFTEPDQEFTHPLTDETITGEVGESLVVLELPFGSYVPNQPVSEINIQASLNAQAQLGVPLEIESQGGFAFGNDALDNPNQDPPILGDVNVGTVIPNVLDIDKTSSAPESETATGGNFPVTFKVKVDIADQVTLNNLQVDDFLPNNIEFIENSLTLSQNGQVLSVPTTPGAQNAGNNQISVLFDEVTGQLGNDLTITYQAFVPLKDAEDVDVIDPLSGDDTTSLNEAQARADFDIDVDNTIEVTDEDDFTLQDKSIAIQKGVGIAIDTGAEGATPGDTLEYTLNFQVSDFFSFEDLVITDIFSDGQRLDNSFTPTLLVNENGDSLNTTFDNVDVVFNEFGNGKTEMTFRLSDELASEGQDRILDGDLFADENNEGGTTGVIKFRTVIQEDFAEDFPSGDPSVDLGDRLDNKATIAGILTNSGQPEQDGTAAKINIVTAVGEKSVYAINGEISPQNLNVIPGDTVTYRLTLDLPTADIEDLEIEDFLPLPVFDAEEITQFNNVISADAPAAGEVQFGPDHNLDQVLPGVLPSLSVNGGDNQITLSYGDFDTPESLPATIDILFTVTAKDEPFGDGLLLTNQFFAQYGSTNQGTISTSDIEQITLNEPVLNLTKTILATSNSNATATQDIELDEVTFNDVDNPTVFSGNISSSKLENGNIDSDLENIDAGDKVRFGLVIENIGSSARGAFDVLIRDLKSDLFEIPTGGINLQVTDGNGNPLAHQEVGNGLFDPNGGILLDDNGEQGAIAGFDPDNGENIVVITYELESSESVVPNERLENQGEIVIFAGSEGGNDLTEDNPDGQFVEEAFAQVGNPAISKQLVTSSEGSTVGDKLTIGEIGTYRLTVTLPEGEIPNLKIVDQIPDGMKFISFDSLNRNNFSGTLPDPTVTNNGGNGEDVIFEFGAISVDASEGSQDNKFTLRYQAQVLDVPGNQGGTNRTELPNVATVDVEGDDVDPASSNIQNVSVVEPRLTVEKDMPAEADAGDTITVNLSVTNNGTSDAFEVTLTDTFDNLFTNIAIVDVADGFNGVVNGNTVEFTDGDIAKGDTATFTLTAVVTSSVQVNEEILNTAVAQATTLPGDQDGERTLDPVEGQDSLRVRNLVVNKNIISTSEGNTVGNNVVVGELIEYQVQIDVSESSVPNLVFEDLLEEGLAFVSLDSVAASDDLSTDLAGGFNEAEQNAEILDESAAPEDQGRRLRINFGNVENNNRDNNQTESITITYTAVVIDADSVNQGSELSNEATAQFGGRGADEVLNQETVIVVEPQLALQKQFLDDNGDPQENVFADNSEAVKVRLTIEHLDASQATAFDVSLSDPLPEEMQFQENTLTLVSGQLDNLSFDNNSRTIEASVSEIAVGADPIVIEFEVLLVNTLGPNSVHVNTGNLTWSSISGDPGQRSTFNDLSTERTDQDSDDAQLTVENPTLIKQIVNTSEEASSDNDVLIGEIVQYRLEVDVPAAQSNDFILQDILAENLEFIAGSAKLALVSDQGLTSEGDIEGAEQNNDSAPTFDFPDGRITTTENGDGSTTLRFDIGDLLNDDGQDTNAEKVILDFQARVRNIAENQQNTQIDNTFTVEIGSEEFDDGNTVSNTVIEPELIINQEQFLVRDGSTNALGENPNNLDAGDRIEYQVTLQHNNDSQSEAFDIVFRDSIPEGSQLDTSTVTVNGQSLNLDEHFRVENGELIIDRLDLVNLDDLAIGDSLSFTYQVTLNDDISVGESLTTDARASFTSIPGENNNERVGNEGDNLNDYFVQDSVTTNLPADIAVATDIDRTEFAIGESVPVNIAADFLEGVSENVVLRQEIPDGVEVDVDQVTVNFQNGSVSERQDVRIENGFLIIEFGDVTIGATEDFNPDVDDITVSFPAIIQNVASNQDGVELFFNTTITSENDGGDVIAQDTAQDSIEIIEPVLVLNQEQFLVRDGNTNALGENPNNLDAGDRIEYQSTLQHDQNTSRSEAFDIVYRESIPENTQLDTSTVTVNGQSLNLDEHFRVENGELIIDGLDLLSLDDLAIGDTLTFAYQVTLANTVTQADSITTDARATFTSTQGENENERVGNEGDNLNDYFVQDSVTTSLPGDIAITTTIERTEFAIGETIPVTLSADLLEGLSQNVVIRQEIPQQVEVDIDQVSVSLQNGSIAERQDLRIENGFLIIELGDVNITGTEDFNPDVNDITVTFPALVPNIASNQNGVEVVFNSTITSENDAGEVIVQDTGQDSIEIVEPVLILEQEQFKVVNNQLRTLGENPDNLDAGDRIEYKSTLKHDTDQSRSEAFDVVFRDTIPEKTQLDTSTVKANGQRLTLDEHFRVEDGEIIIDRLDLLNFDDLSIRATLRFTYQVTLNDTVRPGDTIQTDAKATFTSTQGENENERVGNEGDDLNDYFVQDSVQTTITSRIAITNILQPGTPDSQFTIGEIIPYRLEVEVVEGETEQVVVENVLPEGEGFVGNVNIFSPQGTIQLQRQDFTFDADTRTLTFDLGTVTNEDNNIADDNTFVIDFDAVVENSVDANNNQEHTNQAEVNALGGLLSDSDDEVVEIIEPFLQVTQDAPTQVRFGDIVDFDVTLDHLAQSQSDAHDVLIQIAIPEGLEYQAGSLQLDGAEINEDNPELIEVRISQIDLAEDISFSYQAKVVPQNVAIEDTLRTDVNVFWDTLEGDSQGLQVQRTGNENDPGGEVNDLTTSTFSELSIRGIDLRVENTVDKPVVEPGETFTYTLVVTNDGNEEATGVELTDFLPPEGISVVDTGGGTLDGNQIFFDLESLAPGESVTREILVQVDDTIPADLDTLEDLAQVTDDGTHGEDPTPENNEDDALNTLNAVPDLQITVTDQRVVVEVDEILTYTLEITNIGNQDASGVIAESTLPEELIFLEASDDGNFNEQLGQITWQLGDVAVGQVKTVTVTVKTPESFLAGVEDLTNRVSVEDDGRNGQDPNLANNEDDDVDIVQADPDLAITKTDNLNQVEPGQIVEYILDITNQGTQEASQVKVVDTLPGNVSFISASNGGKLINGEVVYEIGSLLAGQSTSVTLEVQISEDIEFDDTVLNTVRVFNEDRNQIDRFPENNFDDDLDNLFFFVFDGFRNDAEPEGALGRNDERAPELQRSVTLDSIFTGRANPLSVQTIQIYSQGGNLVGLRSVVVDAGGNWMISFPGIALEDMPHRLQSENVRSASGNMGFDYKTRTFYYSGFDTNSYSARMQSISDMLHDITPEKFNSLLGWQDGSLFSLEDTASFMHEDTLTEGNLPTIE